MNRLVYTGQTYPEYPGEAVYFASPGPNGPIAYDRDLARAWYALNRHTRIYLDNCDGSEQRDITRDFDDELDMDE